MYFSLKMAPCYTLNYNWNILHCPINLLTTSAIVIQFLKKTVADINGSQILNLLVRA